MIFFKVSPRHKSIDENAEASDRKTMERLQEIANATHPSIRVTIDYLLNHPDNRLLPVLDIAQWIGNIDVNGENQKKILHSHLMKEIPNRLCTDSKGLCTTGEPLKTDNPRDRQKCPS